MMVECRERITKSGHIYVYPGKEVSNDSKITPKKSTGTQGLEVTDASKISKNQDKLIAPEPHGLPQE